MRPADLQAADDQRHGAAAAAGEALWSQAKPKRRIHPAGGAGAHELFFGRGKSQPGGRDRRPPAGDERGTGHPGGGVRQALRADGGERERHARLQRHKLDEPDPAGQRAAPGARGGKTGRGAAGVPGGLQPGGAGQPVLPEARGGGGRQAGEEPPVHPHAVFLRGDRRAGGHVPRSPVDVDAGGRAGHADAEGGNGRGRRICSRATDRLFAGRGGTG